MVGTVQWFNDGKGYGFILGADGQDVFVHHSVIQMAGHRSLNEGDKVEYEVARGPKGLSAASVRVLGRLTAVSRTVVRCHCGPGLRRDSRPRETCKCGP